MSAHKFTLTIGTPPSAEDMLRQGLDRLREQLLDARNTVESAKDTLALYEADAAEFKRLVDEYLHRMAQFGVTPEPEQEIKAA